MRFISMSFRRMTQAAWLDRSYVGLGPGVKDRMGLNLG